jgi:hypothetical protein
MLPLPEQLVPILQEAARELLAAGDAPYPGDHDTCAGLGGFILSTATELAAGDDSNLRKLWLVFAPTCDWDDARGSQPVANKVFAMLDGLRSPAST